MPPVRCLVNGLQRSGTHLLEKTIGALEIPSSGRAIMPELKKEFGQPSEPADAIEIGLNRSHMGSRRVVRDWLSALPVGMSALGHIPWSPAMADLIGAEAIRMVTILRDPRDVIISYSLHVAANTRGTYRDRYLALSEPERLLRWVCAAAGREGQAPRRSIHERLSLILAWRTEPFNRVVRFERLVGAEGGGSDADRREEIRAIAAHLAIPCSESHVEAISRSLFGGTSTFRHGQIGSWKQGFTPEVTRAFKAVAGDLLVELGYERDHSW